MIVEARLVARVSIHAAATRLRELLVDPRLQGFAESAASDGESVVMQAGVGAVTKRIAVQALELTYRPGRVQIPIRWVATGIAGEMFPALDGDLHLRELTDETTEMALIGTYDPPLGRAGEVLDQLVMRRVARRTLDSFLAQLASAVTDPQPAAAASPFPGLEPLTDP